MRLYRWHCTTWTTPTRPRHRSWRQQIGTPWSVPPSTPVNIANARAFLIAFDQNAAYDSANYLWFRQRLPRFVYVDRIVVAANHRGQGLARRLYEDLFERARAAGHQWIACEVNIEPPNPGSDAFHARLGFNEIGRATLAHNGKTVRYLTRRLDSEDWRKSTWCRHGPRSALRFRQPSRAGRRE
jgi:uncharacterized protein